MKTFSLIFLLLVCGYAFSQLQDDDYGQHHVSFMSISRFDSSRVPVSEQVQKKSGRIHQINIWWPSRSAGEILKFRDYVGLISNELDSSVVNTNLNMGMERYFAWPASLNANKKLFEKYIFENGLMRARRGQFTAVRAPMIMLVHGFAADHAYLAEYLASHGYVVLHVPVKGTKTYELDYEGEGLTNQVLDYEFALHCIKNEFNYDPANFVVGAFSFGAQSSVIMAMRDSRISALVSFDGGIGSEFGVQLMKKHPSFNMERFNIPVLHFYNKRDAHTSLAWLKSLQTDKKFLLALNNMDHGFFTSFGKLRKSIPDILGKEAPDPGNGYDTLMFATVKFLHQVNGGTLTKNFPQQLSDNKWVKRSLLD